jgi:glycosyltransferase involved in cell wall biosynthesis
MISVIVPVYNTEKYLHRCIDSILAQTYTDFELLLIDDGSTDSSGAICDKYAERDSRVRVFHKENGGASSARNLGLDNANGEWITFCDSDDWVYSSWLENYDITNNSAYDLICQGIECSKRFSISDTCNKYSFDFTGIIRDGLLLLKEYNIIGYTVIKLFKRDIIYKSNLRFEEIYNFMEDEEFVLRYMSLCKTMKSVNKIGYYYNVPEWTRKYIDIYNPYSLHKSLFISCTKVCEDEWSELHQFFLFGLDMVFDEEFVKYKFHNKIELMLDYRDTLGVRILKSKRFFISKWIIFIDATGYLSTIILYMHNLLKNKLSQNVR